MNARASARRSPVAAPGPLRVVRVDACEPVPDLSPVRPSGQAYAGAWVLAMRAGLPLGPVEVPLDGEIVPAARLREMLSARFGGVWSDDASQDASDDVSRDSASDVGGDLPTVSVVVPSTFERATQLERCVASLTAQEYPAFEVILVDNRPDTSSDRRALHDQLRANARVCVVSEPRRGISAARNRGVAAATGEVVVFTDDDVEVGPGWLMAIGRRFAAESQTACVTGPVLPQELETPAQIWFERSGSKVDRDYVAVSFEKDDGARQRRFHVHLRRVGGQDELVSIYSGKVGMGANMAFRAAVLRELGGFDEALGAGTRSRGGEDLLIISRLLYAGHRVEFRPDVYVWHTHRRTIAELTRQMYGYGAGYTAMLTALVRTDWRHLVGLAAYAARAARLAARRSVTRSAADYPRALVMAELKGLLVGPVLYLIGRAGGRPGAIWPGSVRSRLSRVTSSAG